MNKAERLVRESELLKNFHPTSPIEIDPRFVRNYFIRVREDTIPDRRYLGGFGIVEYSLQQITISIPGVDKRLRDGQGKLIFLGNGFCRIPLQFATRQRPVFIVDLFNYGELFQDLQQLKGLIREYGLPQRIPWEQSLQQLIKGIEEEKLFPVHYLFGSGTVPDILKEADLIVNHQGPPRSTLEEQLSCLALGGEAWMSHFFERSFSAPEGYERLPTQASVFKRRV